MAFIESKSSNAAPVKIFYQDLGEGKPVVLIHGWPLSSDSWEYQLNELPAHGLRIIAYDRRGFGKSDKPWGNYDYDTLASDLNALLEELDLREVTLVGFFYGRRRGDPLFNQLRYRADCKICFGKFNYPLYFKNR